MELDKYSDRVLNSRYFVQLIDYGCDPFCIMDDREASQSVLMLNYNPPQELDAIGFVKFVQMAERERTERERMARRGTFD